MSCGLGRIVYDKKWNIVDGDGKILSKIWFDEIGYCFNYLNIIRVRLRYKFNFIRKDGSLISDRWWDLASKHVVDNENFVVSNKSDGIIFYVNGENGEITKSDDTIYKQTELSQRAFWENTNKLDINDIHYIINETKNRLLLNEISNNAIETLFKKYLPWITEIFDLTLEQVKNLGKRPEDTRKNVYGIQGMTYCRELGIDYDDDIIVNPDMKIKDWLRLKILKEFEINRGRGPIQYIRGIIRICCSDDDIQLFSRNDYDVNKKTALNLKKFKQIIGYINNNELEFNEDLNGLSFKELNRNIGYRLRHDAYHKWLTNKEKAVKNQQIGEYTVIPMYGFEDTSKYSPYTEWCVTQTFSAYRQYTDDGSQFFFCLKNGFENITRKRGEDCPLDEYGLSMVSVLIRPNGEIKHVTTRWNHDHGGEDNPDLNTFEEIEGVLGIPENAFLTHTRPELELDDIPDMIKKYGADNILTFVDNAHGCQIVKYNDKFNVIHNDILLSEQWFDSIQASAEKFFVCINYTERGWRYNIIDERGLVFPENFSYANFKVFNQEKGIYAIYMSGDCALYQRGSNEPISEKFSKIEGLKDNYARAQLYNTYNFFDENGKKMWDEWKNLIIKPTDVWHEGFQLIYDSQGRCNYINIKTGDILSNEWLYDGGTFYEGFATVKNKKGETNFLKVDGTLLSDIWYDTMIRCGEYFAVGTKGVEMTFLDKNGDIPIHKTWKHAIAFNGEYGLIRNDDNEKVTTIINRNGNEVADIDLNCFSITKNNVIIAFNAQYKVTLVTIDGEYLLPPDLSFVGHKNHKDNCVYLKDEKADKVYEFNVQTSEITDVSEKL